MRKAVRLWPSPLLIGAIAALFGCGDATLVGVSSSPPPPELQRVGSPVPFALLGCSPFTSRSDTRRFGPEGGSLAADLNVLGDPWEERPSRAEVSAAAPSEVVSRIPLRPEATRFPKPAAFASSNANCSLGLRRRSNYAVAW